MDLRVFFQKIKQAEHDIPDAHVVVVSYETPDGGSAGIMSETPRAVAARLIVEAKARLASVEEALAYHASQDAERQAAEERALSGRVMINVVQQPVEAAKGPKKQAKE